MKPPSSGFLDRSFPYWTLLPAVIVFVVLSVYPMLNLVGMSLHVYRFEGGQEIATFNPWQNFSYFSGDPIIRPAIVNTIVFVPVSYTHLTLPTTPYV